MLDVLDCDTYYFKGADVSFFTDRLVTDIINILKFSSNPYDTELFKEICYKTIFKIKKEAVANICEICERYSIDVFDAINRCQYITDNHKKFFFARKSDFLKLSHIKVSDAIDKILYEFDYYKYIKGRKDVNAQKTINSKITTLKVIGRYDKNFYLFLKRFEHLKSIIKSGFKSANSSIILSTIHSSKGLEYNNVHIADVVDGTLPSLTKGKNMSKSDKECYLEERRLFYVAMTRAKNKLFVYSIDEQKSEFISEVRDFLNTDEAENPQTPKTSFKIGDKVKHKTFGTGIVLEIKDNRFVRIIFDNVKHGTKTIDKSYITKNQ
jgi:DNA helicase-2/ATP-dependent DNA helicase PcrA